MRNAAGNTSDEAQSHGFGTAMTTKVVNEAEVPARELKPNTTQFPNILLDKFLAIVEPSDWKIISHIVRKTYGWHKDQDAISATQLSKATGLNDKWCSERCEMLAAAGLLQKGPMAKDLRTGRQLGHMWKINLNCAPTDVLSYLQENSRTAKKRGPLSQPRNPVNPSTESDISGPHNEPFEGHSVNLQKKVSKETIKRKTTLSPEATPNNRRQRFIEHLKMYRERLSGLGTFQPTAKDFRNLDIWLREHQTPP